MNFLFWLFLVGIIVASLQDLKRREVDDWLNLFLLVTGISYIFFRGFGNETLLSLLVLLVSFGLTSFFYFYNPKPKKGRQEPKKDKRKEMLEVSLVLFLISLLFILILSYLNNTSPSSIYLLTSLTLLGVYVISNLMYYGRVFAGGDAKLLFAMTAFFIGTTFFDTISNVGIFLIFLMVSGAVYGLIYSLFLYSKDYKIINKKILEGFKILWIRLVIGIGVVALVLGLFDLMFFILAFFAIFFPILYLFAKGLEEVSMTRVVSGWQLREGDWLVDDVHVGKVVVKADWDGLTLANLKLLKGKKKIKIKDGLPFVPAFLIAFLSYVFLREWLTSFLGALV
ncbi:MAG: hypothetical protein NUV97_03715 [archaeon]|nr:hypothetical protein [archaeon]MCR4323875.1 hypothetical protein [Nanoarchaeota archaeon]